MKKLIFIIPVLVWSCGQNNSTSSANIDTELTSEENSIDSSAINFESVEIDTKDLPESYLELREKFESADQELTDDDVLLLGADPEDAIITPIYSSTIHEMDEGSIFRFWTAGGATDLYQFETIFLAFFDKNGKHVNTESLYLISEEGDVNQIQDFGLNIQTTYAEYEEGEYSFSATGKKTTDDYYYVIDEKLIRVDQTDKTMLPFYRNRIFAHYGYTFKNQRYTDYFKKFAWYEPKHENVDAMLTEEEKRFTDYLLKLEKEDYSTK